MELVRDGHGLGESAHAAPNLLKYKDAAKSLGICRRVLETLVSKKQIPVVRIGRSVRFDTRDLWRLIEQWKSFGSKVVV